MLLHLHPKNQKQNSGCQFFIKLQTSFWTYFGHFWTKTSDQEPKNLMQKTRKFIWAVPEKKTRTSGQKDKQTTARRTFTSRTKIFLSHKAISSFLRYVKSYLTASGWYKTKCSLTHFIVVKLVKSVQRP